LEHPETATSLNNLGDLLYAQGDNAGARLYFERALAIREQTFGPDNLGTKNVARNTAALYYELGLVEDAEAVRRKFCL
jgi:tetratricopeptide (TPR) repeat protein